ncbi:MAG: helix-turn-helix domain-containing protein [Nitrospira sp.]
MAEGRTWDTVCAQMGCSRGVVALWRRRFIDERLAGLYSRHRGQAPTRQAPRVEARILAATRRAPADGSTHWSTRKLAAHLSRAAVVEGTSCLSSLHTRDPIQHRTSHALLPFASDPIECRRQGPNPPLP